MVVPELVGEIDIAHVACAANLLRAIRAASFVDERHDVFRRQFLVLRHRDYGRDAPGRSDDTTVAFVLDDDVHELEPDEFAKHMLMHTKNARKFASKCEEANAMLAGHIAAGRVEKCEVRTITTSRKTELIIQWMVADDLDVIKDSIRVCMLRRYPDMEEEVFAVQTLDEMAQSWQRLTGCLQGFKNSPAGKSLKA